MHNSTNRNAKMDIDIDRKTTSYKQTHTDLLIKTERDADKKS